MNSLIRTAILVASGFLFSPAAYAAAQLPENHELCESVKRETVTALFGQITSVDATPASCTFVTDWNGSMAIFFIMNQGKVPESQYRLLTMRVGEDTFMDVDGVGEKAIVNVTTLDMAFRAHGTVYTISTRGMPCERLDKRDPGREEEEKKCQVQRIEALKTLGKQIAG